MISAERARKLLNYAPETGQLTWRVRRGPRYAAGSLAGCRDPRGYVKVRLDNRLYHAHRIVWLMTYGKLPGFIDHINLDKGDNRLSNLRPCSQRENNRNVGRSVNNTSGFKGVSRKRDKWRARIADISLGSFSTPEAAAAAYDAEARKVYGEFAWLNLGQ